MQSQGLVEDAISGVNDELNGLIESDAATADEVTSALSRWDDFAEGWRQDVLG